MKKLLLLVCCGALSFACSNDDNYHETTFDHSQTLTSQAEVDAFAAKGYIEIKGGLTITGEDITNIARLSTIKEVGRLTISQTSLKNLHGLENITRVVFDHVEISKNPLLESIEQLGRLKQVNGELWITDNNVLISLHGLENVETFEGIWIDSNAGLTSLEGLLNITQTEQITISHNSSLTSLEGLNNLITLNSISLSDNYALSDISALGSVTSLNYLSLNGNRGLTSLHGLEGITALKSLSVRFCFVLPTLEGLQNLKSTEELSIWGNTKLATLEHLSGITSVVTSSTINANFYIRNNASLTSLKGLENITAFSGNVEIIENEALTNLCAIQNILVNGTVNSLPMIANNRYNPMPQDIATGTNCSMD